MGVSELDPDDYPSTDGDPPPPLTISGPDGRRVTIDLTARSPTVGELADILGMARRAVVLIDGKPVDRRVRLDRSGIANGSTVSCRSTLATCRAERAGVTAGDRRAGGHVVVAVEAGPSAGAVFALPPGRHLIGRSATCAIRLDDDLAELHHAVLDVRPVPEMDRSTLVQLAGRVPCWSVDGGESVAPVAGQPTAACGSVVTIGATRIRLALGVADASPDTPAATAPRPDDPWRVTLHRAPRQLPEWAPSPIEPPDTDPAHALRSAGGLLAGAFSVVGGVVLAVVIGHPLYLVVSALGVAATVGPALGRRLGDRRRRRRHAAESQRDWDRFAQDVAAQHAARREHQCRTAPTIATALRAVRELTSDLWSRRADHPDGFTVSLGWGTMAWSVDIGGPASALSPDAAALVDRHELLGDVPVTTDLGSGQAVAIVGEHGRAIARSLIVQLAVLTGPADWRLVVVADDPDEWDWCAWLPHSSSAGGDLGPMIVAADDGTRLGGDAHPARRWRRPSRGRGDRSSGPALDPDRDAAPLPGRGAGGGGGRHRRTWWRRAPTVP